MLNFMTLPERWSRAGEARARQRRQARTSEWETGSRTDGFGLRGRFLLQMLTNGPAAIGSGLSHTIELISTLKTVRG